MKKYLEFIPLISAILSNFITRDFIEYEYSGFPLIWKELFRSPNYLILTINILIIFIVWYLSLLVMNKILKLNFTSVLYVLLYASVLAVLSSLSTWILTFQIPLIGNIYLFILGQVSRVSISGFIGISWGNYSFNQILLVFDNYILNLFFCVLFSSIYFYLFGNKKKKN